MSFWISRRGPSRVAVVSRPGWSPLSARVLSTPRMKASSRGRSLPSAASCHAFAPATASLASAAASRLSALCRSITVKCRLSPRVCWPCVSASTCAGSSSPPACASSRARQPATRRTSSGSGPSPSTTGRAMRCRSSRSSAANRGQSGRRSASPSSEAVAGSPCNQLASGRSTTRAAAMSGRRSGADRSGWRACAAATCSTVRYSFSRSLAASAAFSSVGASNEPTPSLASASDTIALLLSIVCPSSSALGATATCWPGCVTAR